MHKFLFSLLTSLVALVSVASLAAAAPGYTRAPNLPITDAGGSGCSSAIPNTTTDTMIISDSGTINDLNVALNITHTWVGDLTVKLTSPNGTTVTLIDQIGDPANGTACGSGADNVNTILDDESGGGAVESATPPTGASYTPEQALSNFDGENILGTWTLTIIDNNNQDAGTLNAWSLLIDFTPVTGGSDEVRVPQSNSDIDDDGIPNSRDNCPYAANPSQEDGWGSAMGDACDIEWYNLSGIGVSAFPQKDGTFDVYGNCTFMADGDPRCPIIASFDPATFTPDMMPKEFTSGDAGTWSVWVYYLHSNNGADVYQVNTYTTNPPQPDTLMDDRMEIHVYGGSWQWYQRGGRSHGLPNGVGMVINSSGDAGSDSSSEKGG